MTCRHLQKRRGRPPAGRAHWDQAGSAQERPLVVDDLFAIGADLVDEFGGGANLIDALVEQLVVSGRDRAVGVDEHVEFEILGCVSNRGPLDAVWRFR